MFLCDGNVPDRQLALGLTSGESHSLVFILHCSIDLQDPCQIRQCILRVTTKQEGPGPQGGQRLLLTELPGATCLSFCLSGFFPVLQKT